jgi:hypothetical protein
VTPRRLGRGRGGVRGSAEARAGAAGHDQRELGAGEHQPARPSVGCPAVPLLVPIDCVSETNCTAPAPAAASVGAAGAAGAGLSEAGAVGAGCAVTVCGDDGATASGADRVIVSGIDGVTASGADRVTAGADGVTALDWPRALISAPASVSLRAFSRRRPPTWRRVSS